MQALFGIPTNTLALVLATAFLCALAVVAILAVRNRVFLRLGVRNVGRRRSRTLLILAGLMLGSALISAALNTGDTLAHTVRSSATTALGNTDELVAVNGVRTDATTAGTVVDYFDETRATDVRSAADASGLVKGVAPAIIETVAIQDTTSRQTEAKVGLFAADPASMSGFGSISGKNGSVALSDLASGEAYINAKAADKLGAKVGDELLLYAGAGLSTVHVKDIVKYSGTGTPDAAVLLPLAPAQELVGKPARINYILLANKDGVGATTKVIDSLRPTLDGTGLEIKAAKKDALKEADDAGNSMMLLFTTFGTFSIVAGILLIFLIFVMLAAERKAEMGISRALGTQRANLVQMFLFEGVAYDLAAAAIGVVLGVGVGYVMVIVMAYALASFGVDLQHAVTTQSMVIAYTLGALLTLIVVTVSAWQVSVLNIVRAVRNLPDPVLRKHGRGSLILALITAAAGALLIFAGLSGKQAAPFHLGASLVIIAAIPFLRWRNVPDRAAYTIPGLALSAWWLTPFFVFDAFLPAMSKDFTIFVLSGLMVVLGVTWAVMYNSDIILNGAMSVFGRVSWIAPMLKAAIAYPLRNRFRTGVTLAMFTLVVFTLVTMSTIINSVNGVFDDKQAFSGGYDVRVTTAPISPINDLATAAQASSAVNAGDIQSTAALSAIPLKVRQADIADTSFHDYIVRGLDDSFIRENQYEFALMAPGYGSARDVWQAVANNPDLAVIDSNIVPRRSNYGARIGGFDFLLTGFYLEDNRLPPLRIDVNDQQTGQIRTLTVIGVVRDTGSILMTGISTSQRSAAAAYGNRAEPTTHFVKLAPGVDAGATAKSLESAFLSNGLQATTMSDDLGDVMNSQHAFTYILEGFLGLGLIVGVAALGVISARAVVERRQEIGVLRSIGFQKVMVQGAFLLESSFISLLGIALGTVLGLLVAFNVILDFRNTPGWESVGFGVPWLTLALVFAVVYAGSVFATLVPARQASRVYPAEALRYE